MIQVVGRALDTVVLRPESNRTSAARWCVPGEPERVDAVTLHVVGDVDRLKARLADGRARIEKTVRNRLLLEVRDDVADGRGVLGRGAVRRWKHGVVREVVGIPGIAGDADLEPFARGRLALLDVEDEQHLRRRGSQ